VDSEAQIQINHFLKRFESRKEKINSRLEDFSNIDKTDSGQIFEELAFCLLTPQSKAKSADQSIKNLVENNLLFYGTSEEIQKHLTGIRFHITKSQRIVEARDTFSSFDFNYSNISNLRTEIVKAFKGIGYKESSHFLRNIGFGKDIAILDRHILKNLVKIKIIEEVPKTITPKKYLEIEEKMRIFCQKIGINMAQLDLLFWSEETGEIIK
jgi:N-glycosylase/DNA lyase